MYSGDIALGATIDIQFTTRSFTTGAPTTLSGSPAVSAYVDNGTTELTAGITLSVDFDSRTGLNNVRVVASGGNGFAAATNVSLVITAGTVGGVSVVGEVIGGFSIQNRVSNMTAIDGQATAGNNATLNLKQLNIVNSAGDAIVASSTGSNGKGINASGNGSGAGLSATGGATGNGVIATAGASGGVGLGGISTTDNGIQGFSSNAEGIYGVSLGTAAGIRAASSSGHGFSAEGGTNKDGIRALGNGAGSGISATSGNTGHGIKATGGSSSGDGFNVSAAGSGLDINAANSNIGGLTLSPTDLADIADAVWDELIAGHLGAGSTGAALNSASAGGDPWSTALPGAYASGTAGHIIGTALPDIAPGSANGLFRAGSNTATSIATALTANVIGNITGNLSGSVGSVTAGVTLAASAVQAIWDALTSALTTAGSIGKFLIDRLDATITSRMATYTQPTGFLAATFPTTVASPTNITAGTITTVVNLTNAPTAGDFTAAMKASLNASTPASIVGAVGSVTGNVGGNVVGSVASVVAPVAIDAASVDAIWDEVVDGSTTARQSLRLANSANGGKLSGAATTTVTIRDLADTKNRVVATVDASGNRTAVSRDLT